MSKNRKCPKQSLTYSVDVLTQHTMGATTIYINDKNKANVSSQIIIVNCTIAVMFRVVKFELHLDI